MNNTAAATRRYAASLRRRLAQFDHRGVEIYVLPPFTSLAAAQEAFIGSEVGWGGQTMHWNESGASTGEISAPMLAEAGCRYVELAHSERLAACGETYPLVRRKVDAAVRNGLTPILCLGESPSERRRADAVLANQLGVALGDQPGEGVARMILAYEPRWAIGAAEAADPAYVARRLAAIRAEVARGWGVEAGEQVRIVYGGAVSAANAASLVSLEDCDGLFIGRAAWEADGFADIIEIVCDFAQSTGMA